ncbi:DUF349 domain-containing protein [Zunongwangia sp. HGR-M22]|uniref:DUF349 domain-containing protein n=1 Tax=Zunongwangia sp. HGR-M22 TaxID=3015168 RepID=UPI0022DDAAB7|nr:DUF349 domain-containing protein [Zunongwangia sp. HGR-M22]WBL24576.1 DUF349 domain-containing protein [Zunongwangia sp. HGR-M22]
MSQSDNENKKEKLSNKENPENLELTQNQESSEESKKEEKKVDESFSEEVENPEAANEELEEAMVAESTFVQDTENNKVTNAQDKDEDEDEHEDAIIEEHKKGVDDSLAEDSEDESVTERHNIPKKDYHSMSNEQLADELERLLKNEKVQAIKDHVIEIRAEFNAKFDEEFEEKKENFLSEGGNIIDFHYSTPLKNRFNSLYFDYREKRNKYYQQLKQDLNANLSKRLEIIEELKGIINIEENINTTYNHFKDIQDKWRTAGPIPRDKYNNVWNTYHHHVENFYDFLHLNREFRDMDFKHNLDQKLKVIDRAEELAQEQDINRAFRELQMLHKMWKEELGPVAKEYREEIWERFSNATKIIHDRRQEYFENLDKEFDKNWEKKQQIIEKIREIANQDISSHSKWQQKIKEIEALREDFFKAGKVPRSKNEETWKDFKETVRSFNRKKNSFYKNLKKEQYENLEKKKELIQIAEDNKDSDDFKTVTPLMKKIQTDWKKIGHVPRKDSDKIWKQFKAACNYYFDRLHENRSEENKEEMEAFTKKKDLLEKVRSYEFAGNKEEDLEHIKAFIAEWKTLGRVPYNKRFIEGKFNKSLDQLFNKLDINRTKAEMLKYENKIQSLNDADDDKKIRNEHFFLTKKIEETQAEIRQLENNLQFFSNVDDDNPLVQDVHKNINDHKAQLKVWREKLKKVKSLY